MNLQNYVKMVLETMKETNTKEMEVDVYLDQIGMVVDQSFNRIRFTLELEKPKKKRWFNL